MSTNASKPLFAPLRVGKNTLQHRVILAPLTRFRSTKKTHIPIDTLVPEYYAQRASVPGTLLITEATFIDSRAGGYDNVPGIWSDAQIEGWKKVTDAVHSKGSFIYLQLWALGRAGVPSILAEDGHDLVSASDIPLSEKKGTNPRPLTVEEIKEYVGLYAQAAENAIDKAGFDGVEVHGANGYLIDQFTQSVSNIRTDAYGGSIENRARFAQEVVRAVVDRVGADKVGVRFSPYGRFQDMKMPNDLVHSQFSYLISSLAKEHPLLAYLHLVESRSRLVEDVDDDPNETLDFAREAWKSNGAKGPLIVCGAFDAKRALEHAQRWGDEGVVFGRWFISNPDLPTRIRDNIPFTPYNRETFYTPENSVGYLDYPFASAGTAQIEKKVDGIENDSASVAKHEISVSA